MAGTKPLPSFLRWLFTVIACLVVTAALGLFKFTQIRQVLADVAARPEFSQTVETTKPQPTDFRPRIDTMGVVTAPLQVVLRNELAGYIAEVGAKAGARVTKGQLILQLDVSEQRANLASAKAKLALAKSVLQRDLNLQKTGFVSDDKVDHSRADVDVATAEIEGVESIINRRTIRAPFAGVIGIHHFEPGQYLNVNTEITTLVGDSSEMWVDFNLPQFYGELTSGNRVDVRIVRTEGVGTGTPLQAEVIAGDSTINSAARSRRYRAVVREGAHQLLDNMSVSVVVPLGLSAQLLAVPSLAVQSDVKGQYVWVLDRDKSGNGFRARRQGVTIFGQRDDLTFVDGVTADDLIAGAGAFKLSPGVLVKSSGAPPEGPAGGAK
ncbi:MAG TPA: efflux RND transporter periplasmic adaptor subunit [Candidatus Acidoferrum sp.]|nr:efflux RND transporter periplasmic adaptor subunit [Candidatus Acidoferrum sp.]